MATPAALIKRLRRLVDDVAHGFAQSAPDYTTDLSSEVAPAIAVQMDGDSLIYNIPLGPVTALRTGQAIAAAIQRGVRQIAALNLDNTEAYSNAAVTFDRKDGYTIRGGTIGSSSQVRILPPMGDRAADAVAYPVALYTQPDQFYGAPDVTPWTDAAELLKLGAGVGGYESPAHTNYSDEELLFLIEDAVSRSNQSLGTGWQITTIPAMAENIVIYRAWASVVDINLGRYSTLHRQKVEGEESYSDQVFGNTLQLAEWLRKAIEEFEEEFTRTSIEVSTVSRWSTIDAQMLPDSVYVNNSVGAQPRLLTVVEGATAGDVIVEFDPVLSTDLSEIYIGHSTQSPVIDRAVFTHADYDRLYSKNKGFEAPATLARTLKSGKNTVLRLSGFTPGTYFFAMQTVDVQGNRYFSNEIELVIPAPIVPPVVPTP
jgi:hypothetical protein